MELHKQTEQYYIITLKSCRNSGAVNYVKLKNVLKTLIKQVSNTLK